MSKRSFRWALGVVVATFAVLSLVAYFGVREVLRYPDRPHEGAGADVTVKISKGMRFPEVAEALAQKGVVDRPTWFRLYAMHRGLANRVRAGTYTFKDNATPRDVLDLLVKGVEEIDVTVTVPEGKNLLEVLALIGQAGVAEATELEALARDPEWLKQAGIEGETVEGYLYPDTYRFKKPSPPKVVLETVLKQHRIVYDELAKKHARSLDRLKKQLGWGDREVVTLASIVEKETGDPAERARVASVFVNRLTLASFPSRRLETDPTIRYGCTVPRDRSKACRDWDPSGRLHRAQLDDGDNAYNTYQHAGLPPGPISNPGRASLEAAMAPEPSGYLYFVAKDERTHVFSKTYEEHARWVQKYQK
ncbi:MAG TPA: endolytic transglycosylase MltG [Haliangiales bacterium]|nr:endolytic transglycosylase MltG [Haliangiales bacterium]